MNSCRYQCDYKELEQLLTADAVGAFAYGVAAASEVDEADSSLYRKWLDDNFNAGMEYMERNMEVRCNPDMLLPGVRSLIVCAFAYPRPASIVWPDDSLRIAAYALGDDYHEVVRRRLDAAAQAIKQKWGGECRVCVDTAPLRERYWAHRSGLGYIGLNGLLMVPGAGSCFFLGTILTTIAIAPKPPVELNCGYCRRCIACCPAGAIKDAGKNITLVDSRKCLSCLTIEHRGDLPENTRLGNRLYGCDTCQSVCPHNRLTPAPAPLPEFMPRPALLGLTKERVLAMTRDEYTELFRRSAIKRAKLEGLLRNARHTS
ncbi:MAG: tRNA epoxyqueuosine(34) reductase QueG [Muribaculaceae bacterium]|jgi:epoxyqueuosine reductase|nr:tRNA epoxyqueuosine(34) reductase QueG [Muribaculaceae bacterium]